MPPGQTLIQFLNMALTAVICASFDDCATGGLCLGMSAVVINVLSTIENAAVRQSALTKAADVHPHPTQRVR